MKPLAGATPLSRRQFVCGCCATGFLPWHWDASAQPSGNSHCGDFSDPTCPPPSTKKKPDPSLAGSSKGSGNSSTGQSLASIACSISASSQFGAGGGFLNGLLASSGNTFWDTWLMQEYSRLSQMLQLRPQIYWFQEPSPDKANAFAMLQNPSNNPHGMIGMGLHLANSMLQKNQSKYGIYAGWIYMCVLAHEFAHIQQFQAIVAGMINPAKFRGKGPELHGDWFAGMYMAFAASVAQQYFKDTNLFHVMPGAMATFYSMGDTEFTSPQHHGTHKERAGFFQQGIAMGQQMLAKGQIISPNQIFQIGRQLAGY